MEFKKILKDQQEIKQFSKRSVPTKKLKKIISQAQQAPSLLNSQPWRVYISMPTLTNKIRAAYYRSFTKNKPIHSELENFIPNGKWDIREAKNMLNYSDSVQFLKEGKFSDYTAAEAELYQAQILAVITIPKVSPAWSLYDLGSFSQCLHLAAKNEGVDSLNLYSATHYPEIVHKYLKIPDSEAVGMVIALGHRAKEKNSTLNSLPTLRLPFDSVGKFITE
ncbi:hypothetical protein FP435_05330 [Lactobacillus sp. PV037]|uniref:nitroreductase family protein n=1 Tax=unclassified Lactobacillus TaxID=2620435 RepID=UPI00223ECFBF|nr:MULTISPECIES: nitroreductase family protein [unclassified Lactobacillus]QNQ82055.1 hypothetical protein FP433_02915 [Lactobacillus sp. PV012]QNQ83910.1 hypothetical protein FP435_05330 [Lactobacillus sp. PV037]